MTITIPAGTTLYREDGVAMYVADDSTADIIGLASIARLWTYEIKFEDGEEYLVHRADLLASAGIHTNPGNNVTHVNGADVTEHGARRRIS